MTSSSPGLSPALPSGGTAGSDETLAGDAGRAVARLLLEAARPVAASARADELRRALAAVARAGAADDVVASGIVHGVLPLLARRVDASPPETRGELPEPLVDRLGGRRRHVSLRNLHQIAVLGALAEAFEEAGVPALAFKGPVLASTVYPDLGLREFVDLDLLVAEEHREEALGLLRSRGFEGGGTAGGEHPRDAYAVPLARRRDGIKVDLHWRLAPAHRALSPDPAGILRRAEVADVQGRRVRVPCVEDHLLLLAVHGAKHGPRPWPKLKWIADVAWLLDRRRGADWTTALERARAAGSGRALLLAVALARDVLGTAPPPELAGPLRSDPRAAGLAREVRDRLFLPPDAPEPLLRRASFDWRVLDRPRDRLGYVLRRLFLPTGRDRDDPVGRRLPRPLLFAYRWARLLTTYLRKPSRMLRHWD